MALYKGEENVTEAAIRLRDASDADIGFTASGGHGLEKQQQLFADIKLVSEWLAGTKPQGPRIA